MENSLKAKYIANFGSESVKPFVEHLIELDEVSQKNIKSKKPPCMTEESKEDFDQQDDF